MYNSTHHIFTTMTKSHTNVSQAYANLISTWTNSNNGMMQTSPITTSMSQRYWRLVFTIAIICISSCIFTTRIWYSARTHWARNNMEIHLVFTLQSNFKPLVSRNLARIPCSKCLLSEDEKYVYVMCSNPSSLPTRG